MKKGTVERERRIDSFDMKSGSFLVKPCRLMTFKKLDGAVMIDGTFIEIDSIQNAAGQQDFFLCPRCGRRVRFLYLPDYVCRTCAGLNYRVQQVTRGSFTEMRCIADKIDARPPPTDYFDYATSGGYELIRPRYMRKKRFRRYEKKYYAAEAQAIEKGRRLWARYLFVGIKTLFDDGGQ